MIVSELAYRTFAIYVENGQCNI